MTTKNILYALIAITAIVAILSWSDKHDQQVNEAADKYEQCIKVEYHTTPSAFYAEHNQYPTCNR